MELKDLVGLHVLSGVDTGILRRDDDESPAESLLFVLDGETYRVTEDENDGYRSSMREIEQVDAVAVANRFEAIQVLCRMRESSSDDVLECIDVQTGKIVLEVGTSECNDYYPSFVANFDPQNMSINASVKP